MRFNRSEHRLPNGISAKCARPQIELPHTRGSPTHVSPFLGRAAIGAGNVYPWAGQVLRRMLTAGTAWLSQVTVRLPANTSTVPLQGTAGGVQTATGIVISVEES